MVDFVLSDKQFTEQESKLKDVRDSYDEAFGFHDDNVDYSYISEKGIDSETVFGISDVFRPVADHFGVYTLASGDAAIKRAG